MKPLPVAGSTVTKVRPDFVTYIYTDGNYDLAIEAPMHVQTAEKVYIIDPREGKPDPDLLNVLLGKVITIAEYSFREGLVFVTDDGARYRVPPIEHYESWQCIGAKYYIAGYLLGNQPDVPRPLTDSRRFREHDYFLEDERELARDEAGAIAINARFANVGEDPSDEYGRVAGLVTALGQLSPFWTEAKWIPVEEWLDPIRLSGDPGEIERAFLWLNSGYLMSDNSVLVRELRLTNDDYSDGLPRGAVELIG